MYGNAVQAKLLPAAQVHVDGDSPVTVKLLGGDLQIFWNRQENLVYMTGPAATVFDGEIDVSFLK